MNSARTVSHKWRSSVVNYDLTLKWTQVDFKSLLTGWKMNSVTEAKSAKPADVLLIMPHLNVKIKGDQLVTTDDFNKPDYKSFAYMHVTTLLVNTSTHLLYSSLLWPNHTIVCFLVYRKKQNSMMKNMSILYIINNKQV